MTVYSILDDYRSSFSGRHLVGVPNITKPGDEIFHVKIENVAFNAVFVSKNRNSYTKTTCKYSMAATAGKNKLQGGFQLLGAASHYGTTD